MGAAIPLREIATPSTPAGRREVIIANAKSMIGLSAWSGNPAARAEFEDILGPLPPGAYWDLDRPFHVENYETYATVGVSTCGLVVRGNQRRSGVADPNLWLPYEAGTAFSGGNNKGFIDFARKFGAWKADWSFFPGCYLVVGSGLLTHTFTCVDMNAAEDWLQSVDGGDTDKDHGGLQYISTKKRKLSEIQYVGHVDPDLLPFRPKCLVPPNYAGGFSTGKIVTLLVFAGLGYLAGKHFGPQIIKRAA
ncbi:MAG: hypothetical protein WC683_02160 [bacterium]